MTVSEILERRTKAEEMITRIVDQFMIDCGGEAVVQDIRMEFEGVRLDVTIG